MSTSATASADTRATTQDTSFWDRFRRPRVVGADVRELLDSPVAVPCENERHEHRATAAAGPGSARIALAARWKGGLVGGALLEARDRTAFVRLLHVDATWRGRGVGRRLLKGLLQRASFLFVRDVVVSATVAEASFYGAHGFRPLDDETGEREVHAMQPGSDRNDDRRILLHRRLTSGFVSVPYDGFTVKM